MRRQILLLALILLAGKAVSQITGEFREMFLEAESYFLFEEYIEALPYYEPIHREYPDNDNINYKMGVCFLNDPYEKEKSIEFLEKASENINLKYKENSFRETKAPLEAYFYLGNAYRINGQLDRAIEIYEIFKSQADPELYDLDLVDEQIQACENAKDLQNRPVDYDIVNLGDRINTRFSDVNPVISGDETKIVYIQKQAFFDALAYCEKLEDGWSFPRILMQEMAVDEDAYPTALNYEGDEMILYRSDNFIGDLYTSRLVDGFWTPPVRMNDNINTKYWESHGCFTRTGDTLYFTSNRKGTIGGLDIYYSIRGEDGEWGPPVNLGPTINTRYNEETPFITKDGKTLYFSSYGHYNMGGYDVFYSTMLDDGEWSVPVNAGYPLNTTDDDLFFHPVRNGTYAYFPRILDEGFGLTDIYLYEIYSATHPRKFMVSGILGISNVDKLTKPVWVTVIEQHSRDTVSRTLANPETGEFSFEAPVGAYDLLVMGEEIEPFTTTFVIPEGYKEKELALTQAMLITQAAHLMEITIQDDIKVRGTKLCLIGYAVQIDLTLERRANLYVDIIKDGKYFSSGSFAVTRRQFTYFYIPVPGDNLLKFKLIDRGGNHSYMDVRVIYTPQPESITTVDSVVVQEQAQMEEGLEEYLERLQENAGGELKGFLSGIDLVALGIITADQLDKYLIEQAAIEGFSEEDVSRLLVVTPVNEQEATEKLRQDLAGLSEGELEEVLMGLDLKEEGISSEEELIFWLREHVDEHNYSRQAVHDLVITNMQAEYLSSYQEEMLKLSDNEALNKAIREIDFSEIGNLQELYDHLISETDTYGYTAEDVNRIFAALAQKEELHELHKNLTGIASGDLLKVLQELDTDEAGITSSAGLISYLINEAENNDYTEKDAVSLLIDYLGGEDLREIIKLLIGTSSGELMTLLLNLNTDQNNITNLDALYAYLIDQAAYYDFTEEDVIRLFLNLLKIIEHEPIVQEIPPPPVTLDVEKGGKGWLFFIFTGVAIVILVLLFARRRKKDNEDESA